MKKVILIFVLMTNIFLVNLQAEYTRDSGIVTSAKTLLQWQDNFEDVYNSDEYNNGNTIKRIKWEGALKYCKSLTLGGHTDWRLPNINELISKLDYTRDLNVYKYYHNIFQGDEGDIVDSSTSYFPDGDNSSISLDFASGRLSIEPKSRKTYVRCVRDSL